MKSNMASLIMAIMVFLSFSVFVNSVAINTTLAFGSSSGIISRSNSSLFPRAHAGPPDSGVFNPHSITPDTPAEPRMQTGSQDLCKGHDTDENGNHFCQNIQQVVYTNVNTPPGQYKAVTSMNKDSKRCDMSPRSFGGDLAPFNEPISMHFHGPLHLKQFAFYLPGSGGSYARKGYYHAPSQTSEHLTFMGNFGGQGSGVFTSAWGASLSFANSRGDGGASSPTILADAPVSGQADFSIFTSDSCADGSCGYIQPGAVGRKGFPGTSRIFLFEFSMPHDATNPGFDKPAIWLLNARIPYTQQYGACSCWDFGCGEFDIFEVVNNADTKALSTFHLNPFGAGDPNWFKRPVDGPIKVLLYMDPSEGGKVSVKMLGGSDGGRFGATLSKGEVDTLKARSAGLVSDFAIRRS